MSNVCLCCCNILFLHLLGGNNYTELVVVGVLHAYFSAVTNVVFSKIFASVAAHANNSNEMRRGEHCCCAVVVVTFEMKSKGEIHVRMHQFAT